MAEGCKNRFGDCGAAMSVLQSYEFQRVDCEAPWTEVWLAPDGSPSFGFVAFDVEPNETGTKGAWAAAKVVAARWRLDALHEWNHIQ